MGESAVDSRGQLMNLETADGVNGTELPLWENGHFRTEMLHLYRKLSNSSLLFFQVSK